MDIVLRAYYQMIDDCAGNPDWQVKIEEDVGSKVAYLMTNVDEYEHDFVTSLSPSF